MGCFSGCLMSSSHTQKLFCGIYFAFKCSFDEFVEEKVVSLSYSSTILVPPLLCQLHVLQMSFPSLYLTFSLLMVSFVE